MRLPAVLKSVWSTFSSFRPEIRCFHEFHMTGGKQRKKDPEEPFFKEILEWVQYIHKLFILVKRKICIYLEIKWSITFEISDGMDKVKIFSCHIVLFDKKNKTQHCLWFISPTNSPTLKQILKTFKACEVGIFWYPKYYCAIKNHKASVFYFWCCVEIKGWKSKN